MHYLAGSLTLGISVSASATVIPGPHLLVYAVPAPHYHLPAKHHDLIQYGTEVGLVVIFVLVGCRLVACRLLRPG